FGGVVCLGCMREQGGSVGGAVGGGSAGGGLRLGGAVASGMLLALVGASIFVAGGSVAAMSVGYTGSPCSLMVAVVAYCRGLFDVIGGFMWAW
ncbi:hypothetical protein Dimus_015832, partial [Dionaea muscipula]